MKTLICPCCKKSFYSEYYEDGYIDHVYNFSAHAQDWLDRCSASEIATKIITDGNGIRSIGNIKERKKCFLKWGASSELRAEVVRLVDIAIDTLETLDKDVISILDSMTDEQKSYLYFLVEKHAWLSTFSYKHTRSILDAMK